MDLDLRIPVGFLFVTLGLIMAIFGLISDPAIYAKSLGINVNLDWGIVELIFGSLMIAFGRSHREVEPLASSGTGQSTLVPPRVPPVKPPVPHG